MLTLETSYISALSKKSYKKTEADGMSTYEELIRKDCHSKLKMLSHKGNRTLVNRGKDGDHNRQFIT